MKANLVVVDLETGGYEFEENPITEVSLHIISPTTFKTLDRYQTYVKPYNELVITQQAINATQVNIKDVENGIEVKTLVKILITYFKKARNGAKYELPQLVFHNGSFDILFLEYAFMFCGEDLYKYVDRIPICTMRMTRLNDAGGKFDKTEATSISLATCCERFSIKLKSAHGAENDVIATIALLKVLVTKLRGTNDIKSKQEIIEPIKQEKSRKFYHF